MVKELASGTRQDLQTMPLGACLSWDLSPEESELIQRHLLVLASNVECKSVHWVHGSDESLSYCYDCAKSRVDSLLKEDPEGGYLVDGGWESYEDGPSHCEECGVDLECSLTLRFIWPERLSPVRSDATEGSNEICC